MINILNIIQKIDIGILVFINTTLSNRFFDLVMPLFDDVKYSIPIILILWIFLGYMDKKNRYKIFILIPMVIIIGDFIGSQIKHFVLRPRPWTVSELDIINLGSGKGKLLSFPSNHSLNIMGLITILIQLYSQYKFYFLIYACIIMFSRIYIGVHYPSDVLVGGILGFIIGIILLRLFDLTKNLLKKN